MIYYGWPLWESLRWNFTVDLLWASQYQHRSLLQHPLLDGWEPEVRDYDSFSEMKYGGLIHQNFQILVTGRIAAYYRRTTASFQQQLEVQLTPAFDYHLNPNFSSSDIGVCMKVCFTLHTFQLDCISGLMLAGRDSTNFWRRWGSVSCSVSKATRTWIWN